MGYAYRAGDCSNYAAGGYGNYAAGGYAYQAGGIFSSIGKAIGGIAKIAGGILPGPLGTVARGVSSLLGGRQQRIPTFAQVPSVVGGLVQPPGFPAQLPGLGPELQQPVGTMLPGGFIPGCQLKGTRPNKSGYYKQVVKGNPAQVVYIPKGSVCVKTRRINVANPRALRRSIRRAQGFAKLARRVLTFVGARAPRGRAKFKRKR